MKQNSNGLSRRQWIGISFLGGAGLATATVVPPLVEEKPDEIIRKILEYRLAPAPIPDDAYNTFLTLFQKSEEYMGFIKAYKIFSAAAPFYPTGLLHRIPQFKKKIQQVEEIVFTDFTLSTNYFTSEAVRKGEEPIIFIADRGVRACNNPFATFDDV
ncbi:MAG TPA: hypothetical protein DHW71_15265 [Gammaproteobacteria bacterium]|nr:hypothetical protein [Pseudomonadota bacterium]HBF09278.1 hypothetical protein [Gammaproteobacteria bacterium]HCK94352.1 hypothetical protein [Gammaproteobacteria bacterium]|tara:strand:- start:8517 stop:8987 length:471 start_codon:yes stop_codon:yes gene_type:complete